MEIDRSLIFNLIFIYFFSRVVEREGAYEQPVK